MFRYVPGADVLEMLKNAGYSSYRLRQEKILGERALQKIRSGGLPSWHELNTICKLTQMGPWDIIEYVPDESNDE